jgi:hypothetical protein
MRPESLVFGPGGEFEPLMLVNARESGDARFILSRGVGARACLLGLDFSRIFTRFNYANGMLDLPDYLKPLEFLTQPYPKDAVDAVLARGEEAIPPLLQVLERLPVLCARDEWGSELMIHEYALYLLSEFGERRAFPLILEIARLPVLDDLLGDGITEALPKALAATFFGELNAFYPLIEDQQADEFARGSALSAIGILFKQERITRSAFECCLMELYALIELEPVHVWDTWVSLVADFRCTFLLDKVRTLYERGFADPGFQSLAEVEAELKKSELTGHVSYGYKAFSNVHDCMSWWHCFSEEYARSCNDGQVEGQSGAADIAEDVGYSRSPNFYVQAPHIRESAKVGRNDTCPCGSGKKYKKCCL